MCNDGFVGTDCSLPLQPNRLYLEDLNCRNEDIQSRFGQTFLANGNEALLYGGRGLGATIFSDVWSIDFVNQSCLKLKSNGQPPARYYHCGVVFQVCIFSSHTLVCTVTSKLMSFYIILQ